MTIKNTLQSLAQASEQRSKMGRLREALTDIEAAKKAGVSNAKIVEALNAEHGLNLTVKTFETMLYRLRKASLNDGSTVTDNRVQPQEIEAEKTPVLTSVEAPKNTLESVSQNDEVEAYISPKKRREDYANSFISNDANPLLNKPTKE